MGMVRYGQQGWRKMISFGGAQRKLRTDHVAARDMYREYIVLFGTGNECWPRAVTTMRHLRQLPPHSSSNHFQLFYNFNEIVLFM